MSPQLTQADIRCARCGAVHSTVKRDHDNIARCDTCYRDEYSRGTSHTCSICHVVGDHSLSCPTRWYR